MVRRRFGWLSCRRVNDEAKPIRVLVADDDEDIRELLSEMINREDAVELVGAADEANSAIELAEQTEPDVAVLDWMPASALAGTCSQSKPACAASSLPLLPSLPP